MTATLTKHGLTASLRRSRRVRYCEDRREECIRKIEVGEQYVRAVMFPNHDASGYDQPAVMTVCVTCAALSDLAPLVTRPGATS